MNILLETVGNFGKMGLPMPEIRELTEQDIPAAHDLSVEVFGESASEPKYSLQVWKENLGKNGLLLGTFMDGALVGFKFGYEREPGSFHSWLGGVREPYRHQGIMRLLTERQEAWARSRGYRVLTVNTYQEKFPAMYKLLIGMGYAELDRREGKSFFRKEL